MISYDYHYDFTNHAYRSEFIDQDSGVLSQSFCIPTGIRAIHGVRIKLSKYGEPGPVHFSLGNEPGDASLARGTIQAEKVLPVFELLVGGNFPPAPVSEGQTLFLNVWVENAHQPLDAYRIYGPNTRHELVDEGNARVPHWWHDFAERLDDVNAPLPIGYAGAGYPDYQDGNRVGKDGNRTWSITFQVFTDLDDLDDSSYEGKTFDPTTLDFQTSKTEDQFEFARKLLAPPFSEWVNLRDSTRVVQDDKVQLDENWAIRNEAGDTPALRHALEELPVFLERAMGIQICGKPDAQQAIVFSLGRSLAKAHPETFRVETSRAGITIQSGHGRGFLRAVYWLEDLMLAERAPVLPLGTFEIMPKYELRMAPGIYPAPSYFMLREAQVWTPGYMWRFSRAGYNAVYFQASLEDFVEDLAIFPEMNDPEAPDAIERLRRCVELGAEYGVDFYWDIKTGYERKFAESVYERLPQIRSFEKFGNFPCTGQPIVLDFLRETIAHVFSRVDKLKGTILVYDTEGFYSCFTHNSKDKCPYCREYPVEVLTHRVFATIQQAMKPGSKSYFLPEKEKRAVEKELILLTYICDEPWNYRVIESMPADVSLLACYSQLKELDRCGVRVLTDDYSLCSDEPSDYFLKVQSIARRKGLRFYCKTEDTFGQEFVSTPFTPCLEQHQRRWTRLEKEHVDGFISQYIHIGFMPTPCQDLTRQNVLEVYRDGKLLHVSPQEKLLTATHIHFGRETAGLMLKAWEAFSIAIRDYFPYTWGVCRYPGPLQSAPGQPFFMDPEHAVPRPWARGYVNDLKWTRIVERFLLDKDKTWDYRVVARCLARMNEYYSLGNSYLGEAMRICRPVDRDAIASTQNVASMQHSQIRTILNLITFIRLRDAYSQVPSPALLDGLVNTLEAELDNAQEALRISQQDSRLGFSCEGDGNVRGGHFNPYTIGEKINGLRATLKELDRSANHL